MAVLPYPFNNSNHWTLQSRTYEGIGKDYTTEVYGRFIPLSQGRRAIMGAPVWAGPVSVTADYESKGHNGPPEAPTGFSLFVNKQYRRSFAVAFGYHLAPEGDHEEPKLLRMWIGEKLVYDARDPSVFAVNQVYPGLEFTFYPGSEAQEADALIVADKGDLAPAFKGMVYIVFKNVLMYEEQQGSFPTAAPTNPGAGGSQPTFGTSNLSGVSALPMRDALAIPIVRAEFADGLELTSNGRILPYNEEEFPPVSGSLMVDWGKSILMTGYQEGTTQGIIAYDMEAEAEAYRTPMQEAIGFATTYGFMSKLMSTYDIADDIIVTTKGTLSNCVEIVTVRLSTGQELGQIGEVQNIPYKDGNLHWYFSNPVMLGDIFYAKEKGKIQPVAIWGSPFSTFGEDNFGAVAYDPTSGAFNTGGNGTKVPDSMLLDLTEGSGSVTCVYPCPIWETSKFGGDQDVSFFVCKGNKIYQVFYTVRNGMTTYLGRHEAWELPSGFSVDLMFAFEQSVCCYITNGGTGENRFYAIKMDYVYAGAQQTYDYLRNFRGYIPTLYSAVSMVGNGPLVLEKKPIYDEPAVGMNIAYKANWQKSKIKNGIFGYFTTDPAGSLVRVNLRNGKSFQMAVTDGPEFLDSAVWREEYEAFYGYNSSNIWIIPFASASTNEAESIGNYMKWVSLKAGYELSAITVAPELSDPVTGMILDVPWAFADIWDRCGQLYDFATYQSEGKIKFVQVKRSATKATGDFTASGLQVDGNTVTIGDQVYVFRAAPALAYEVKIGATAAEGIANLIKAVNVSGNDDEEYGDGTLINTSVVATTGADVNIMRVTAIHGGSGGNSIPTLDTANGFWGNLTLTGGEEAAAGDFEITRDEMMSIGEGQGKGAEALITTLNDAAAAPGAVKVSYWDYMRNYEYSSSQTSLDTNAQTAAAATLDLQTPIVMTPTEAYRRASKISLRGGDLTITQEFRLPPKWLLLEPSDVVRITIAPYSYVIRMDEVTLNGDYSISVSGVNFSTMDDIPVPPQIAPVNPPGQGPVIDGDYPDTPTSNPGATGDGKAVVIDAPSLYPSYYSDTTITLMTGVETYGQPFAVGVLSEREEADTTATVLYDTANAMYAGNLASSLPAPAALFSTDYDTVLRVTCKSIPDNMWASATYSELLEGVNCICVGAPGRWEYIYFKTATKVGTKVWELTGLLRGRRGTDNNVGNHAQGDAVYLLASKAEDFVFNGVTNVYRDLDLKGEELFYSVSGVPSTRVPAEIGVEMQGLVGAPWAPVQLKAEPGTSDSVDLSWVRRDPIPSNDFLTEDVPLTPGDEEYDVEIMDGDDVVRTVSALSSPAYNYSSANQTSDGFTAPVSTIKFRVYQVHPTLGRGIAAERTVNVE